MSESLENKGHVMHSDPESTRNNEVHNYAFLAFWRLMKVTVPTGWTYVPVCVCVRL